MLSRLRASPAASTSRQTLDCVALEQRRGKKKAVTTARGVEQARVAKREAFYERMNVTDDTRVLDQRDVRPRKPRLRLWLTAAG